MLEENSSQDRVKDGVAHFRRMLQDEYDQEGVENILRELEERMVEIEANIHPESILDLIRLAIRSLDPRVVQQYDNPLQVSWENHLTSLQDLYQSHAWHSLESLVSGMNAFSVLVQQPLEVLPLDVPIEVLLHSMGTEEEEHPHEPEIGAPDRPGVVDTITQVPRQPLNRKLLIEMTKLAALSIAVFAYDWTAERMRRQRGQIAEGV